jgi:DNA-directed RNA polymerase subunit RPC12/RpoP
MIQFNCSCGKSLKLDDAHAGRRVRCPDCGSEVVAPESTEDEAPPQTATSGKAIASLVLGIASFLCAFLTGIPAIILGILGLRDVNRSRRRTGGTGLAIAGIVTGSLGTAGSLCLIPVMVGVMLPAVQKVREAANRMSGQNNLHQLALGMHNYQQTYGRFPAATVYSKEGKPLYSWRVTLLPFLVNDSLYKQFKLDEPWDSPNNIKLLPQMPKVYLDPSIPSKDNSETVYQVFVGKGTAFESRDGEQLASFTDGTSNTLLIVEAASAVPWTKPEDLLFAPDKPLPKLGGHHSTGFNAAFADATVRFLPADIDEKTLRALITRNGAESVTIPQAKTP